MTRMVVTGGTGQLATALARAAPGKLRVVGRPGFDLDRMDTFEALFVDGQVDVLVNAAAWTAVDAAEASPAEARRANAEGPALLAALCRRHGTKFVHISTDYVFDGAKGAPYVETDPTCPAGVYGATKLEGELGVMSNLPDAVILRTAWVYAETGRNFVRTMLAAAKRTDTLRVVADQVGCPTNADDLAAAVLAVAARVLQPAAPTGIYHCTGSGETSWYNFARAIFAAAGPLGWKLPQVQPIATADWPTPARRPADSRLECGKLAADFGLRLPHWQPSLQRAVAAICTAEAVA